MRAGEFNSGPAILAFALLTLVSGGPCQAQSGVSDIPAMQSSPTPVNPQPASLKRPSYNLDPSDEDWSFLSDASLRSDAWDRVKYIPLGRQGWYVSLGGEFRGMYEFYRNYNWGAGPQSDNGYYLNRLIGHTDFHFGTRFRVFLELKSGVEYGRNGGPRLVQDEDKLDLSQLFLELQSGERAKGPAFTIKLGRQELQYGEGALLDVRELNVRRAFDGVKFIVRPADWRIDLFAMKPARSKPGFFDDYPDSSQTLWGVYAVTNRHLPRFLTQLDVYYLGLDRKSATFAQGAPGREQRHTAGILVHGQRNDFSYFAEADFQFGRFGVGQLSAWKYAQNLSYTFSKARFRPTASFLGAISSGDKNPADPDLQTFHPLFPKGLYYGYIDDSGSLNAIVVHPKVNLQLSRTLSLTPDSFFFWRQRTSDGLYSQPGFLLRKGLDTQARYVGALQELALTCVVDRHTAVQFIGAYYEVGPFLRQTQPTGKNTAYFSAKLNYKF